jgi:hypothetical protein
LPDETDRSLTWSVFFTYLTGLMVADTRLSRHFAKEPEGG